MVLAIVVSLARPGLAETTVGSVRIRSTPAGATVYLSDTNGPPLGTTPYRGRVEAGEQTFILRLAGYEELRITGEVSRRRTLRQRVELQLAAYLDVQAGDEAAFGAELEVSGLPAGRAPARLELAPGRQLVVARREGYEPTEQWFTLARGETQVWSVELGIPNQGSILVTADVEGAAVWLDGIEQGEAPLVLEAVAVGEHVVELRTPTRRPYIVPVLVGPGEQATLAARLSAERGELQIIGNVDGAVVRLNGQTVGELPFLQQEVRVGPHILEIAADGYETLQETIEIVGGMRRVLAVRLETNTGAVEGGARQSIIVTSDAPDARVAVDGRDLGLAPATLLGVAPDTYEIEVTAPDHQPYRTRCTVAEGGTCSRNAVLYLSVRRLDLTSQVPGAALLMNGRPAGPLPYSGGLPDGEVELTVQADGYVTWSRRIAAEGDTPIVLEADLRPEGEGPPGLLLRSGFTVPASLWAFDLSSGWPTFLEARLDRGVLPMVDAGGALRSVGRLFEVEARGRYSFSLPDYDFLVFGGAARVGAGMGPRGINTFFVIVESNTTVHWRNRLSATLIQGIDFYTDHYPYAETDSDVPAARTGRQNTLAYRLGLGVDVVLWASWSLWANFEWTAARTHSRRVLGDVLGAGREAERVAGRLGLGFTF